MAANGAGDYHAAPMQRHLQQLTHWLAYGGKILTGEVKGRLLYVVDGWIEYVGNELTALPTGQLLKVEWLGLPLPHTRYVPGEGDVPQDGFSEAIQARCNWLSKTVRDALQQAPSDIRESAKPPKEGKPTIFIGSSREGLDFARALELQLHHEVETTIWKDGVFGLSGGTLETLVEELPKYDFAALVLTPDDVTESREATNPSPRDNVLFELGLFMGRLGRHRTFVVFNRDAKLKLPSDLAGVTCATFAHRTDNNHHAQMSPPSTQILDAVRKHGRLSG